MYMYRTVIVLGVYRWLFSLVVTYPVLKTGALKINSRAPELWLQPDNEGWCRVVALPVKPSRKSHVWGDVLEIERAVAIFWPLRGLSGNYGIIHVCSCYGAYVAITAWKVATYTLKKKKKKLGQRDPERIHRASDRIPGVKIDLEFGRLFADLTNNEVRLTQLLGYRPIRGKLTQSTGHHWPGIESDPKWTLFGSRLIPGVQSRVYTYPVTSMHTL